MIYNPILGTKKEIKIITTVLMPTDREETELQFKVYGKRKRTTVCVVTMEGEVELQFRWRIQFTR